MRAPSSDPRKQILNEAQLFLTQLIAGKMAEVPSTLEGVRQLRAMNVPQIEGFHMWLVSDWLYDMGWTFIGKNFNS
jgi:hypothetical protein